MKMTDCLKFDACSAPVCPLDPQASKVRHLEGERVCFYLTEYSKPGARAILKRVLPAELYGSLTEIYPDLITRAGPLRKQLQRSSKNPPKVGRRPGEAAA